MSGYYIILIFPFVIYPYRKVEEGKMEFLVISEFSFSWLNKALWTIESVQIEHAVKQQEKFMWTTDINEIQAWHSSKEPRAPSADV